MKVFTSIEYISKEAIEADEFNVKFINTEYGVNVEVIHLYKSLIH